MLELRKLMVSIFSLLNKNNKIRFFSKIFLLIVCSLDIIFEINFFIINNININI